MPPCALQLPIDEIHLLDRDSIWVSYQTDVKKTRLMNAYVLNTSVTVAYHLNGVSTLSARAWQERLFARKVVLVVPSLH